jgi:hypothetical protein
MNVPKLLQMLSAAGERAAGKVARGLAKRRLLKGLKRSKRTLLRKLPRQWF